MASGPLGCKLSLSQSNSLQFDLKEGVPRKPREKIWGSSNGINRAPACVLLSSFRCKCNPIFHTSCSRCSHLPQWIGNDFHWAYWPFQLTCIATVPGVLGGHPRGIMTKTVHKTLPGSLFCMSKTVPCAAISSYICSTFKEEVVYYLLCMPLLSFFGVNFVKCPEF